MHDGLLGIRFVEVIKLSVWLQEKSWEEAAEAIEKSGGVAIIPVGSVEQHGYHLPVGTDTYVAISLAEDAAKRTNAVVVPPLWYGWSPHHMVLPGTITVRPEVLADLLYDIIESLTVHDISKVVVINGHRIVNITWMQIAAQRAQANFDVTVRLFDPAYMSKEIMEEMAWGPVGHAEEIETSDMLFTHPELVNLAKAVDNPHQAKLMTSPDPAYPLDTLCYVPSTLTQAKANAEIAGGTVGRPTKSDAAKGKIYHEHLVDNLVRVVESLQANA